MIQVLSRLSELETTLDAGIRHRNKALTSISFHLTKWLKMVYLVTQCIRIVLYSTHKPGGPFVPSLGARLTSSLFFRLKEKKQCLIH